MLALMATLVCASPARADEASEAKRTTLFQEAKKLASEGRWAEASAGLREVIAIRSAPKALIALALVERELLHHLEAKRLLEQAVADGRAQNRRVAFVNAALRGRPIGGMPIDGGGKVAGDLCSSSSGNSSGNSGGSSSGNSSGRR